MSSRPSASPPAPGPRLLLLSLLLLGTVPGPHPGSAFYLPGLAPVNFCTEEKKTDECKVGEARRAVGRRGVAVGGVAFRSGGWRAGQAGQAGSAGRGRALSGRL